MEVDQEKKSDQSPVPMASGTSGEATSSAAATSKSSATAAAAAAGGSQSGLVSTAGTASVNVSLHPLVILNISDHWTRMRAQTGLTKQVIGAIIGKQKGRNVEVINSFELKWDLIPANENHPNQSQIIIDREYYTNKEEQFKQVFSDLDFLGWYTTGDGLAPSQSDLDIHRQICEIADGAVFLKMAPSMPRSVISSGSLPISFYESFIDIVAGNATHLFVEIPWTLATEEAERIGLDHMAGMSSSLGGSGDKDSGGSSLAADHLRVQYSAVKMLRDRVKIILDYAREVQAGGQPWSHEIIRELAALCHRLPAISGDHFHEQFYQQFNDVALISFLAAISKGTNSMNQFVQKYNVLNDRTATTRRMRTLYF